MGPIIYYTFILAKPLMENTMHLVIKNFLSMGVHKGQ